MHIRVFLYLISIDLVKMIGETPINDNTEPPEEAGSSSTTIPSQDDKSKSGDTAKVLSLFNYSLITNYQYVYVHGL